MGDIYMWIGFIGGSWDVFIMDFLRYVYTLSRYLYMT